MLLSHHLLLPLIFHFQSSENGRSRAAEDGEIIASNRKEFFSKPDIISIHVRLNNETKNLISSDDFSNMRFDSLFVNTSRAGLIEEGALLAGLNKGPCLNLLAKRPLQLNLLLMC